MIKKYYNKIHQKYYKSLQMIINLIKTAKAIQIAF